MAGRCGSTHAPPAQGQESKLAPSDRQTTAPAGPNIPDRDKRAASLARLRRNTRAGAGNARSSRCAHSTPPVQAASAFTPVPCADSSLEKDSSHIWQTASKPMMSFTAVRARRRIVWFRNRVAQTAGNRRKETIALPNSTSRKGTASMPIRFTSSVLVQTIAGASLAMTLIAAGCKSPSTSEDAGAGGPARRTRENRRLRRRQAAAQGHRRRQQAGVPHRHDPARPRHESLSDHRQRSRQGRDPALLRPARPVLQRGDDSVATSASPAAERSWFPIPTAFAASSLRMARPSPPNGTARP